MITIVEGNILDATEDIICQQVNCLGVMGAGLAKQIVTKYPEVYKSYKRFCKGCKDGDNRNLLGEIQTILTNDGKVITNLFSQYGYGRDQRYTNYGALKYCLESILKLSINFHDLIAIPYNLGCGLAGGDWDVVYKIIDEVFIDYHVTIYRFEK